MDYSSSAKADPSERDNKIFKLQTKVLEILFQIAVDEASRVHRFFAGWLEQIYFQAGAIGTLEKKVLVLNKQGQRRIGLAG